jgi:DNA-binding phage protein
MAASNETLELQQKGAGAGPLTAGYRAWLSRWSQRIAKGVQGAQKVDDCQINQQAQGVKPMALTRSYKETVIQRVQSDSSFAQALLDEAATLFLNGEPETARLVLRDLVNATIGFEQLATLTAKPSKSLHRMLSPTGNPSMDNLAAIFRAVREKLQVNLQAHSVAA